MQTITTTLYSFNELSPEAKAKVIANRIKEAENDEGLFSYVCDEMMESLRTVTNACGLRLLDWSFGLSDRNWKVKVSNYDVEDLDGPRALAWFLRILIDHGYERPKKFAEMKFPGKCGFTGVCYDEDVVETVWKELLNGKTVRKAFDKVAYTFCKSLESEYEYLTSEECIMDMLDEQEEIYKEDGSEFRN